MATTTTAPAAVTTSVSSHAARITTATVRVIIGLLFTMTGANGFLNFMPGDPSAMSAGALKFSIALAETGYMVQLSSAVQLIAGILLLTNRYVPLALTMLAPMVVNIFLFHVFLEPSGLVLAVIVSAAEVYLAWVNRDAFRSVLRATR
ncbi:hypothetical protein Lesp02_22610 [Lentzea sp. NBRC 105346]|uniref:DoxX family membrane protein n=1 Tax=Lentzea sp. NBRC 105346 TaxID=3032205 RepID=UPI0024A4069D|nr:DoxX family membrane protein [Lentzea sp. NBRC 105346]GLZ30071.1 hypothetical protein Lesp02_22610 [Lentzea sp. NBRC 105346]